MLLPVVRAVYLDNISTCLPHFCLVLWCFFEREELGCGGGAGAGGGGAGDGALASQRPSKAVAAAIAMAAAIASAQRQGSNNEAGSSADGASEPVRQSDDFDAVYRCLDGDAGRENMTALLQHAKAWGVQQK